MNTFAEGDKVRINQELWEFMKKWCVPEGNTARRDEASPICTVKKTYRTDDTALVEVPGVGHYSVDMSSLEAVNGEST